MRFQFSDARHPQRLAKLLKSSLAEHGIDEPLHACRALFAEACGWSSWHELEASAGRGEPSAMDEAASADVAELRRRQQRMVLVHHGLPADIADEVLDAVRMTGARPASSPSPTALAQAFSLPPGMTRSERVATRGGGGRKLRQGYGMTCALLSSNGAFFGICLGESGCYEQDNPPEGLYEALAVGEGYAVSARRAPRPPAHLVGFVDDRSGEEPSATVLLVDAVEGASLVAERLDRADVADFHLHPFFPAMRCPDPAGILCGWGYDRLVLAAFSDEARDWICTLHDALLDGRGAFLHHSTIGLVLVDCEALPLDLPADRFVHDLRLASFKAERTEDHTAARVVMKAAAMPSPAPSP